MAFLILALAFCLTLPWGELPHIPPVSVSPKVHLICWYTTGFE